MARNPARTVYIGFASFISNFYAVFSQSIGIPSLTVRLDNYCIEQPSEKERYGNLDEKVSERVLYEILIQVGRIVDLYIPRDKETNRHRGYAFAEYETEEIAEYAVKLFSGLVRLHNKTLKFAISGQDKTSQNSTLTTPKPNSPPVLKPYPIYSRNINVSRGQESSNSVGNSRVYGNPYLVSPIYPQASYNGLVSQGISSSSYGYSRQVLGSM